MSMQHPRYDLRDHKAGQPVLVGDAIWSKVHKQMLEVLWIDANGTPATECGGVMLPYLSQPPAPQKPPRGVMPRKLWLEARLEDLQRAIKARNGVNCPGEWLAEEHAIVSELYPEPPATAIEPCMCAYIGSTVPVPAIVRTDSSHLAIHCSECGRLGPRGTTETWAIGNWNADMRAIKAGRAKV